MKNKMSNAIARDSNMELLRLLAISFIVLYHLVAFFTTVTGYSNRFMHAMILMLHTGVMLFVLISGYYGIHFSFRGLLKLIVMVFVYYVPLMILHKSFNEQGESIMDIVFFISRTPYWYIRTYLILFMLSPIINSCISLISNKQRWFLIVALCVVSIYFGMMGKDSSLSTGKNLVCFFNLYLIGNTIRHYQDFLQNRIRINYAIVWLVYNVLMIGLNIIFADSIFGKAVFVFGYKYCSPGLLINSVLLFLAFTKVHFQSKWINQVASSVLAVYLIQEHPFVRHWLRSFVGKVVENNLGHDFIIVMSWLGVSISIVVICLVVDKLFSPLWKKTSELGLVIDQKMKLGF